MRAPTILFQIAVIFPAMGCAAILGLDTGKEVAADAGSDASEPADGAALTDAQAVDSGPKPPVCAPDTADCNGNPNDGCEVALNTSQHCGSCTKDCGITASCISGMCCFNDTVICTGDSQCCSGKCKGNRCGH